MDKVTSQTGEVHYYQYTENNKTKKLKLLPDTELTEYPVQLLVIGDLTGDLTQKLQAAPDVEG